MTLVGVLGGQRGASVDERGTVRPERVTWELGWWIGADDRWHLPRREIAVRQSLLDGMPVVSTAMRVPGGDAVHRVYAATPAVVVVDIQNSSPSPFVATLVLSGAAYLSVDGATVFADGRPAIVGARAPARWAVTTDRTTEQVVTSGDARADEFTPRHDRGARLEAAFLYPVAHATQLRMLVPLTPSGLDGVPGAVPDPEQVARGWRAQLQRGMGVQLPDPALQAAVDTARAQLLLAGQAWLPDPGVVAVLEAWGFDDEARTARHRLGVFARRKAARRPAGRASWDEVRARAGDGGAGFLAALASALVSAPGEAIELLVDWPAEWRGQALDVRDASTRLGPASYSLRWHEERVALLWDVPAGVVVRIPAFDPGWSSSEPRGEVLLTPIA
jgi:hypothetical protein